MIAIHNCRPVLGLVEIIVLALLTFQPCASSNITQARIPHAQQLFQILEEFDIKLHHREYPYNSGYSPFDSFCRRHEHKPCKMSSKQESMVFRMKNRVKATHRKHWDGNIRSVISTTVPDNTHPVQEAGPPSYRSKSQSSALSLWMLALESPRGVKRMLTLGARSINLHIHSNHGAFPRPKRGLLSRAAGSNWRNCEELEKFVGHSGAGRFYVGWEEKRRWPSLIFGFTILAKRKFINSGSKIPCERIFESEFWHPEMTSLHLAIVNPTL